MKKIDRVALREHILSNIKNEAVNKNLWVYNDEVKWYEDTCKQYGLDLTYAFNYKGKLMLGASPFDRDGLHPWLKYEDGQPILILPNRSNREISGTDLPVFIKAISDISDLMKVLEGRGADDLPSR